MYTITRQCQWPEGNNVVEISYGGIDYTNPDALVSKYPGEFETFDNPIDAANTAIEICKAWRNDGTKDAKVGVGSTGGYTMPFEVSTFKEVREWSKKEFDTLEKCPICNAIVQDLKEWYLAGFYSDSGFFPYDDGYKYCSESCATKNSDYEYEVEV